MTVKIGSSDPYAESAEGVIYLGVKADQEIEDILEHETLHLIIERMTLTELESILGDEVDREVLILLMRGLEYRDAETAYDIIREQYFS